jgi:hypothetical protein
MLSFTDDDFVELSSCPFTSDMTYFRYVLNDTLPSKARLAFRFLAANENNGVSIDELEVLPAGPCEGPETVRVDNITATRAEVLWDFDYYNEDGEYDTTYSAYFVAYGPAATFNIHDNSTYSTRGKGGSGCCGGYYLDGLAPNTEYAFAAAKECSSESQALSNWSRVTTARTRCLPTATLPYIEDFNSYTNGIASSIHAPEGYPEVDLPECWSFLDSKAYAPAFLCNGSSYSVSGNSLVLSPDDHDTIIALLPTFEEDIRNLKLTFSYRNYFSNSNYPKLSVGYMASYYSSGSQYEAEGPWNEIYPLRPFR